MNMSQSNAATDSIQLYLNSRYADQKPNGDTGICVFTFPQIDIPDGHYIYLSLQNAIIPYSFYSINPTNNVFIITSNGNTYTVVIEPGNYNITQMISALKFQLGGLFDIIYSSITNKITITNTTYDFIVQFSGSTLNHALGFSESQITPSVTRSCAAPFCVNLNQIRAINIDIDMPTYNINVAQKNNQNIMATIPVITQPYGMINYTNPNNFRINMYCCKLQSIRVKLLDNQNNLINMNGVNYQMTLQVDIISFT
jgi:hypothetical protein